MSERTLFSLRFALPGYTFILVSALVAYPELFKILFPVEDVTLIAAFLAFLSLLGGSALGFLVSQVWYLTYNLHAFLWYGKIQTMIESLDKYDLVDDKDHQLTFVNYIVYQLSGEGLIGVVIRRYDLMHTCGSTLVATIIGSIFGVLVRVYMFSTSLVIPIIIVSSFAFFIAEFLIYHHFGTLFPPSHVARVRLAKLGILVFFIPAILIFVLPGITAYDQAVFLVVTSLIVILFFILQNALKLLAITLEFCVNEVIRSGRFPVYKAKIIFPKDYFDNEN